MLEVVLCSAELIVMENNEVEPRPSRINDAYR